MDPHQPWPSSLPDFKSLEPAQIEPAVRRALDQNRAELAALLARDPRSWDELVVPIERMHHRLARIWSPVSHLNSVLNGPELRAAYQACLPLLTSYHTELAQNDELCAAYGGCSRAKDRRLPRRSASCSRTRCAISGWPVSRCRRTATAFS
jgi:oligopeptidase A